jgi:hypothetical protein
VAEEEAADFLAAKKEKERKKGRGERQTDTSSPQ